RRAGRCGATLRPDPGHHPSSGFGRWRRWLTPRGKYVALLPLPGLLLHKLTLPLYSSQRAAVTFLKPNRADLEQLADWVRQKRLRTVLDGIYPLEELGKAMERSRSGRPSGKIVVRIDG
ncbi:zinc-binding dehydrogenase, partial [Methylogaea oryzae]|uniref:zinc-binding dehydrogenase n=1 Tax=Methylogaea oryzae TaxID=1295382 RepID=UPI0012E1A380